MHVLLVVAAIIGCLFVVAIIGVILLFFWVTKTDDPSEAQKNSDLDSTIKIPQDLEISDPPVHLAGIDIGKSKLEDPVDSSLASPAGKVVFETDEVGGVPLGEQRKPQLERTIMSLGDPRKGPPSQLYWTGAKFELNVWFYVHNWSTEDVALKDIKADVYHISMFRARPGLIPWAPRVDLALDNTADLSLVPRMIRTTQAQPIHLVFETSVFDTLFTNIVFGLTVDYAHLSEPPGHTYRIPSDRIFTFYHDHRWGSERCVFRAFNSTEIDDFEKEVALLTQKGVAPPGDPREFFGSLRSILHLHVSRGQQMVTGNG
jgi:hypothetical protein